MRRAAAPEPVCPEDGTPVVVVIHKRIRCYRCPECRMVYDSVSGRVDAPKGRIPSRYLRQPGAPLATLLLAALAVTGCQGGGTPDPAPGPAVVVVSHGG